MCEVGSLSKARGLIEIAVVLLIISKSQNGYWIQCAFLDLLVIFCQCVIAPSWREYHPSGMHYTKKIRRL